MVQGRKVRLGRAGGGGRCDARGCFGGEKEQKGEGRGRRESRGGGATTAEPRCSPPITPPATSQAKVGVQRPARSADLLIAITC